MKNKEVHKMQQGGWSKRPYHEIRSKVKTFDDEGESKRHAKLRKKPKVHCRMNDHDYQLDDRPYAGVRINWYRCTKCGKVKWSGLFL